MDRVLGYEPNNISSNLIRLICPNSPTGRGNGLRNHLLKVRISLRTFFMKEITNWLLEFIFPIVAFFFTSILFWMYMAKLWFSVW